VRRRADAAAVGTVQATLTEHAGGWAAEVAWVVGVPWQGRGYATEATRGLVGWLLEAGAGEIVAHVHPGHAASARVAAAAGLVATDEEVGGERVWRRPGRG
jgi:RimJ/RimL family protein N-acetyltransferase